MYTYAQLGTPKPIRLQTLKELHVCPVSLYSDTMANIFVVILLHSLEGIAEEVGWNGFEPERYNTGDGEDWSPVRQTAWREQIFGQSSGEIPARCATHGG